MIFITFEYAFVSELTYLGRKAASVDLEIISKLLTVEWDLKAGAACFF